MPGSPRRRIPGGGDARVADSSPPPTENFEEIPEVTSGPYGYGKEEKESRMSEDPEFI